MHTMATVANCVDINADPPDRLTTIAHINDERAVQLIAGRLRPSVRSLTGINGIGRGRIRDILEQDLARVGCGHRAASARQSRASPPCSIGCSRSDRLLGLHALRRGLSGRLDRHDHRKPTATSRWRLLAHRNGESVNAPLRNTLLSKTGFWVIAAFLLTPPIAHLSRANQRQRVKIYAAIESI